MLTTRKTTACTRNDPVNTQHSNAAAEPMANQMEVILKVLASSARKPTAAASQRMGEICMVCYLLMLLLYGIPLGEGQEFFTGTLHRKQNIDKNGKERMKDVPFLRLTQPQLHGRRPWRKTACQPLRPSP